MTTGEHTAGFDFFAAGELPAPIVSAELATRWAEEAFGLVVRAVDLGSQQDANFLLVERTGSVDAAGGVPVAVMKISNSAFDTDTVEDQDRAAQWIADSRAGLRTPTRVGELAVLEAPSGSHIVRLIRFLEGGTLHGSEYLSPATVAAMGRVSGEVSAALADLPVAPADRVLQWDLRQGPRVVDFLAGHIADTELRERIARATHAEARRVERVASSLPVQVVHGDLTDDNLMRSATAGERLLDGVIDFGDLMLSWRVAELATTISSVLHHDGASAVSVLPAIRSFHRACALSIHEVEALWPLVVIRGAVLVASGHQQVSTDESNDYARDGLGREQLIFDRASAIPSEVMTELIAQELGLRPPGSARSITPSRLFDSDRTVAQLDLGVGSRLLDEGAWMSADSAGRAIDDAVDGLFADGHDVVIAPFGAVDGARSRPLAIEPAATWRTGSDVWVSAEVELIAPWPGEVISTPTETVLIGEAVTLRIKVEEERAGTASVSSRVLTGMPLGTLRPGRRYRLTVIASDFESPVPAYVLPDHAAVWMPHLGDPAASFGIGDAMPARSDGGSRELMNRREAVLADVQEHYYALPPRIERGWKHHLVTEDGRVFLDMVNNVTVLGHSHPRVARVIADQWRTFNSNSRFHYASIVTLAEKLTALLPESLDTVFLVNSGSEAVELALRLARVHTGRDDLLALRDSYHGWTYLADAVSTSSADNPRALDTRPDWVHTLDVPTSFRGRYGEGDAHRYAQDATAVIRDLVASGRPPAAFICEPVYGNAGGVTLPAGYLRTVYSEVRRAGGVAIADEVQVGLGRLGSWLWGFEQQDAVPDVVTIAKSLGDGHPLGAVITTKAIAESYAREGYFFSSTGGSPVSSIVGATVLDVIAEEDLAGNARRVGRYLKDRLQELAQRHELIGAVHGEGLYLGVELVRDRVTLEPAAAETSEICERLLERGVIVQPTGNHKNVLKIKPPLSFDEAAADFFADALDHVLARG